jgi:hypothetical protein
MQGDFPPNVIELIQRQLSQYGRIGSTKGYIAPELAAAIAVGAPSTDSAPVNIRFREAGTVIGCYGQVVANDGMDDFADAAAFATTRIRVQVGGQEDIFTDGQSGAFVPFLALFGGPNNWWPLWRKATPGVDWTVTYRNRSTANTKLPDFVLAFIADADLARHGVPTPGGAGR